MAMQRAVPTRISPTRYSSRSGRKTQARPNMTAGPTTQFNTSDTLNIFQAVATFESRSYCTLVSTGYIIQSSPAAMGRETVPTRRESRVSATPGQTRPRPTPRAIVRKIHSGRKRSSTPSWPTTRLVCGWTTASAVTGASSVHISRREKSG